MKSMSFTFFQLTKIPIVIIISFEEMKTDVELVVALIISEMQLNFVVIIIEKRKINESHFLLQTNLNLD